jgi:hypothetical protein
MGAADSRVCVARSSLGRVTHTELVLLAAALIVSALVGALIGVGALALAGAVRE